MEQEKAREKAIQDTKEAFAKIFNVPAEPAFEKPKAEDWLSPDRAAIVDGIKVELIGGQIGPLMMESSFGGKQGKPIPTEEKFFQIRIRVTNSKENFVLQYSRPRLGFGLGAVGIKDEHGNHFRPALSGLQLDGVREFARIDPGQSSEDILAFDMPLKTSTMFEFTFPCESVQKKGAIHWKIPRSFFVQK